MSYFAHETAVIDAGCQIGEGSKIWHFSHLMPGCTLGKGCNIGQNVVISPDVVLGNNVKVQVFHGAVLGSDEKQLQAVQAGTQEMYIGTLAPLSSTATAFSE